MLTGTDMATLVRNFGGLEVRFYFELNQPLSEAEHDVLRSLVAETYEPFLTGPTPSFGRGQFIEIGPRPQIETPWSSNRVAACHAIGITKVTRVETSVLHSLAGATREEILAKYFDKMTQAVYPEGGLASFKLDVKTPEVQTILLLEKGPDELRKVNQSMGLAMDQWDIDYYFRIFQQMGRNPTDVELLQIGNANSEHSRHWFWRGIQVIDGVQMPESLMDICKAALKAIRGHNVSVKAFDDNVGALQGYCVPVFVPQNPGRPSAFMVVRRVRHHTATAETHNHPTAVAPYPGAATGVGGEVRDDDAGGTGSLTGGGYCGYCVGNLFIPGYEIAGEKCDFQSPKLVTSLRFLIEGSNGDTDWSNQFGRPNIGGFCHAFAQKVSGEKRGWYKGILYSGGVGQIDDAHLQKKEPEKGMLIVAIGGPAFSIGVGGGAASSLTSGQNTEELDYMSVQRGNGEMGNKVHRVITACVEMGDENPIMLVHDQGAGGPSNVLTELMGMVGGRVDIRKIVLGDKTMSVLHIWSAEYQERFGFLLWPDKFDLFESICERECVNCEVLGEITADGQVTVVDSQNNSTPVQLPLAQILGKLPQKTFKSEHSARNFQKPEIPDDMTIAKAGQMVLQQLSVGSKAFLTNKKDHSVGGLVVRSQCCGASQVPIADVGVMADSFFGLTGYASAIGEAPLKMLIDPAAGARMAVGEMLTNLMAAGGINLSQIRSEIRCRANWMGPYKLPGEGALLYDEALAMRDAMIKLGIAPDGGKDSSSMASKDKTGDTVKAPGQLVILGYASMPDVTKVLTPDVKKPGESCLGLIDLGLGKNRLGGSALLQSLNQLGDEPPDCDPVLLMATWRAIQILHDCGVLLSYHDRSGGGLFTTVVEMCLGGNCGLGFAAENTFSGDVWNLFSEELGVVVEYLPRDGDLISQVLEREGAPRMVKLGDTMGGQDPLVFGIPLTTLRSWWESTSHQIERIQTNPETADTEFESYKVVRRPVYKLSFEPQETVVRNGDVRPKVAIVRAEGSNGDREMAAAFYSGGCDPFDVHMTDLLKERITLDQFQGLVFPGGFSYMDVFDSGKSWAWVINENTRLREMFDRFYDRPDTWSLGVCNGCQLMALLRWVPYKNLDWARQPRFIQNACKLFRAKWVQVKVQTSPSILLTGMEGSTLGIHIAHGEGRAHFPDANILASVMAENLAPLVFVDDNNEPTENYPFNPNGSTGGITALTTSDGRHLAMMPHFERAFRMVQWGYVPEAWKSLRSSPWIKVAQNAREWRLRHK